MGSEMCIRDRTDVPAGKHKVLAWHPVAGNVTMEVEVKDGATVEANFDIKKKKKFKP